MNYLSLATVKKVLPDLQFPVSELEAVQLTQTISELFPSFSPDEIKLFIQNQQDERQRIFTAWVDADQGLKFLLETRQFKQDWMDLNHIQLHTLFDEFRHFVTIFLYPVLKEGLQELTPKKARIILSYSKLLAHRQENLVQDVVSEWYEKHVKQLIQRCKQARTDTVIYELINEAITIDFLAGLNWLNERHYGVRMVVMEELVGLMHHKTVSNRLILAVLTKVKALELSAEHMEQVLELESDIRKGKVTVEKSKISWWRLSLLVTLILVVAGGVVSLFFIDAKTVDNAYQEETSFMKFSEAERAHLDSLITDVQEERRNISGDQRLDQNTPAIGQQLVKKRDWNNRIFKMMQQAWANNDSVILTNNFSSSKPFAKPYPLTQKLTETTGEFNGEIHNNSLQTILVIVFEDHQKAPVYTRYVQSKSAASWKFSPGDIVVVLPGSNVPADTKFGDMPFKELNNTFYEHLSMAYKLKYNSVKQVKLVWETLGTTSYVLDLSNSMEVLS